MKDHKVTPDTVCIPSEDIVARDIEGDIVIVPLVAGFGDADDELYTLNDTGRDVWKQLDGRRTLREIASALSSEYTASRGTVEADVLGFAAEMLRRGILTTSD